MRIIWKGPIEERRIELLKQGTKHKEIARILSNEFKIPITRNAIQQRCKVSKANGKQSVNTISNLESRKADAIESMDIDLYNLADLDISNNHNLFPDADEDYINSQISLTPEKIKVLKNLHTQFTEMKPKKILSLSDLHSPFINFTACNKALLDNQDADLLILNGDVYDANAMSHFDKIKDVDFEAELLKVEKLLNVVTEMYECVIWVGGNHDMNRFEKFVAKNCGGMKNFFLKNANPMEYLAKKYSNVIIVPHNWVEIGDVIFGHPEEFSSTEMKTVVNVNERFQSIKHLMPNPDYRGIVIGHTHQVGSLIKNDKLLIEQGSMCHLYDYKFQKPSKNKWQLGYAVVNFDDNMKIIFNETNFKIID